MEVGHEVDAPAEQKDDEAAAEDVKGELLAVGTAGDASGEGEDDRASDEEEEGGKDEVGEGPTAPGGVPEGPPDVGAVAGVVDYDHERDGETTEDVDREDARRRCGLHGEHDRLWEGIWV